MMKIDKFKTLIKQLQVPDFVYEQLPLKKKFKKP